MSGYEARRRAETTASSERRPASVTPRPRRPITRRLHAEHRQEGARRAAEGNVLRAAGSEDAAAAIAPGRDAAHGGEMFVVRAVLGRRDGAGAAEVRGSEESHQPARLRVREGL